MFGCGSRRVIVALLLVFGLHFLLVSPLFAKTLYVDNQRGNNAFDGASSTVVGDRTGPTRSIGRAIEHARRGDLIVIRNTGTPYYESLSLVGNRQSGLPNVPLTILGNGAVIDGSRLVPASAWKNVHGDFWRIKPWRKGHYQLLLNGKPVPETRTKREAEKQNAENQNKKGYANIPVGHWTVWRGAIYYHAKQFGKPADKPFYFAARSVGLTLFNAHDIHIQDVTFRGFRLDGINAHDLCHHIRLFNVTLQANGRAGLSVGGTSSVFAQQCTIESNRDHSALVSEFGGIQFEKSTVSQPPTVRKK